MKTERRGSNSRELIVSETMKIVSLKGFHDTSLNDILKATNLSKGAFYNYFKSKEKIFDSILTEARKVWRFQMLHNINKETREIDKVKKIIMNFKNRYLKDVEHFPGGCIFVTLAVELNEDFPRYSDLAEGFTQARRLTADLLERAKEKGEIRSDVSTEHVAAMIFSSIIGTSVFHSASKSKTLLNTHINAMLQYLENIEIKTCGK